MFTLFSPPRLNRHGRKLPGASRRASQSESFPDGGSLTLQSSGSSSPRIRKYSFGSRAAGSIETSEIRRNCCARSDTFTTTPSAARWCKLLTIGNGRAFIGGVIVVTTFWRAIYRRGIQRHGQRGVDICDDTAAEKDTRPFAQSSERPWHGQADHSHHRRRIIEHHAVEPAPVRILDLDAVPDELVHRPSQATEELVDKLGVTTMEG